MLRRVSASILLFIAISVLVQADTGVQNDGKLVRRFDRGCGYSCAQEVAIDIGQVISPKMDDRVAVRFCSREPLPVALTTAAAAYGYVISILEGSYHYTTERVLYLRSEKCISPFPAITATEFWVVPKGAALPDSIESMNATSVRIDSLNVKGNRAYLAALKKLQGRILADSQALGIVVGTYYKNPSALMRRRLRVAKETLDRSEVPRGRYFIRLAPSTGEYSLGSPEPQYPNLFVVEIVKARDASR